MLETQYQYDNNGKLVFKGEYFNSERWNGKGKEYHINGRLKYDEK